MTDQHNMAADSRGPDPTAVPTFPKMETPVRLAAYLTRRFPRRIFRHLKMQQSKFVQDVLVLKIALTEADYPELGSGLKIGLLDETSLQEMIANAEGLPESVYRRRLELGDICYCLKTDGKLACYNWISLTRCATYCGFEQEITFRTLSDLQVFTYDFYTYKAYRNRGYGLLVKKHLLTDLYRRGRRVLLNFVEPDNDASLQIHFKLHYRLEAVVTNIRLMNWGCSFQSKTPRTAMVEQWITSYKAYHQL